MQMMPFVSCERLVTSLWNDGEFFGECCKFKNNGERTEICGRPLN